MTNCDEEDRDESLREGGREGFCMSFEGVLSAEGMCVLRLLIENTGVTAPEAAALFFLSLSTHTYTHID